MKSKSLQQLYAKAAKALEGCEPLTPYETPAYLHEVDRELLVWLFSAALHYGFAQFSRGNRYRSIFLDCPGSPVNVFAKTLPDQVGQGPFILMVGDVCLKPYDVIVVELKALSELNSDHEAQLFNYMRIARRQVGYLLNFGEDVMKTGITRCVNCLEE